MKNEKRKRLRYGISLCALLFCLSGCGAESVKTDSQSQSRVQPETGFVVTGPQSYDSADTAILVAKNVEKEEKTLTFLNLELGKKYTLVVDGTTEIFDKYGESLSLNQLKNGDILDITFLKSKKHLAKIQLSKEAWDYTETERYEIDSVRGELSIGGETYQTTSNTRYFSDNRIIDKMDINPNDILSFYGIGNQVLTVRVEKGHGYLRLTNDEKFVGGWIEIGKTIIERIKQDMLLLVPEGSYEVTISNKGGGGTKNVVINRNEESVLDIGDLEIPEPQFGIVLFSTSPSNAEVYIDGARVDTSGGVSLEYGLHQLIARAEGYQSITQYIRVGQESAGINVVLDEKKETESGSSSAASSTDTVTATDYYKIYVDAPERVELYLDGNYIGITPCSFKKVAGSHVITLRKNGSATRSYTIQVDSEAKDLTYSFVELEKNESETAENTEE